MRVARETVLVRRRAFLVGLAAVMLPAVARAQKAAAPVRIGWLSAGSQPDPFLEGFREGLRKLGYIEGKTIALETRHAGGSLEALRAGAAELARARPAVIAASLTAVRAAAAIKDIPVIFVVSGDPIEAHLAKSLAHPDANRTGITFQSREIAGKRVALIKQAVPNLRTLVALSNTDHPGEKSELEATRLAAQRLGLKLVYVDFSQSPFGESPALDNALEAVRAASADAMVVFPDGATMANRAKLASFAIAQRLPAMFGWSEHADAGGLMSYGASQRDTHMRLATYADRIIRGARPSDLPIEQPERFELVINQNTAKLLGVTIPAPLLIQADKVIE